MRSWKSLTLDSPTAAQDAAAAHLLRLGASGVELRDGELPMPGVAQPPPGRVWLIGYFPSAQALARARAEAARVLPGTRTRMAQVRTVDWSKYWRRRIRAVQVGRFWVGPPWKRASAPKQGWRLVIEPRMAFGTGDHPTTQLCLQLVDDYLAAHPGRSVLDVGTGSGILALAARKAGARRVVGTDNDPLAIENALHNARVNAVRGVEFSDAALRSIPGRFDLVVANILANTLIALAAPLAAKTGHVLSVSGVLASQASDVTKAFLARGLKERSREALGEWVRLDFERPRRR